jgi:hypothetical protein
MENSNFDFNVFEYYTEPILVVNSDKSIQFSNCAAKDFFDIETKEICIDDVISFPVFYKMPDNGVGTITYNSHSYTASFYKTENYKVISVIDTGFNDNDMEISKSIALYNSTFQHIKEILNLQSSSLQLIMPKIEKVCDEKVVDYLKIINIANYKLRRITRNLSSFVNKKLPISTDVKCFDVLELCRSFLPLLDNFIINSNIKTEIVCDEKSIIFFGDPHTVARLILNFLSNSYEHTNDDTVILELKSLTDGVEITVTDHGDGIPMDVMRYGFKQYDRTFNSDSGGLGLGLFIAHRIVELYHGGIIIDSKPGKGTTVTATLKNAAHTTSVKNTVLTYDTLSDLVSTELSGLNKLVKF